MQTATNVATVEEAPGGLRSRYEGHSVLGPLVTTYLEDLPNELAKLSAAFAADDLPALARLGHRLCGDAATYGFESLARAARSLERAAKMSPVETIELRKSYTELAGLISGAF